MTMSMGRVQRTQSTARSRFMTRSPKLRWRVGTFACEDEKWVQYTRWKIIT